jgi:hypothetical protein
MQEFSQASITSSERDDVSILEQANRWNRLALELELDELHGVALLPGWWSTCWRLGCSLSVIGWSAEVSQQSGEIDSRDRERFADYREA